MHINIVTLFPEFFTGPLSCGLMACAREAGILSFSFHNPRDAATDKRRTVDDRPYGGGPGMVMLPDPLANTLRSLGFSLREKPGPGRLFFLSPGGKPFTQALVAELAAGVLPGRPTSKDMPETEKEKKKKQRIDKEHLLPDARENCLTLVCGRYEGFDARIEELFPLEYLSVGDFVLNGGESAALCVIEAVARLLPGFMGHEESGREESFSTGLLEYPHYTRPETFAGLHVPEVLRSGNHERITLWRKQASLALTMAVRPEMLDNAPLTAEDRFFLRLRPIERHGRALYVALVHYPVLDKEKDSVAVSLTNLDIHDIARSSCTYGLGGYYVLTPLADQRDLLNAIVRHWTEGAGKTRNPDRAQALSLVKGGTDVREAIEDIRACTGEEPFVVATTARIESDLPHISYADIAKELAKRPVLLLFGTGHGLSQELHPQCHVCAPPLRWHGGYNHLSVRSAVAVVLDRILGDWG